MKNKNIKKNIKQLSKKLFISGVIATTLSPCIFPVVNVYAFNSSIPSPPIAYKNNWSSKILMEREQTSDSYIFKVDYRWENNSDIGIGDYIDYPKIDGYEPEDTNGQWKEFWDSNANGTGQVLYGYYYGDSKNNIYRYLVGTESYENSNPGWSYWQTAFSKSETPKEVTVPFVPVDPDNNPIPGYTIPSVPGKPGDTVTPNLPTIPGYVTPTPPSVIVPDVPGEPIKVVYTPETPKDVTVPFVPVDPDNNPIPGYTIPSVPGKPGDTVTPDLPTIPGYVTPTPPSVIVPDVPGEPINVVYTPETPKDVTVPFVPVDPDNNPIPGYTIPSVPGKPGDTVTPNLPTIPGYVTPTPPSVTVPDVPGEPIKVVYVPETPKEVTVPFVPVDPDNNPIPGYTIPSVPGKPGDTVTPNLPTIPGYVTPTPPSVIVPDVPGEPIKVVYT
ncbi:DUF5978 domain-containing protein, partial [Carnobacterium gallinarum]